MKFEKINNNKIKVTLDTEDLNKNDIDFHSFMSNSNETHSFFLNLLDKVEKDYNFTTDNYKLRIETLALSNGGFILTITRESDITISKQIPTVKKKFHVSQHLPQSKISSAIFRFDSIDDFCDFSTFVFSKSTYKLKDISRDSNLYCYKNHCYFVLNDLNPKFKYFKQLFSLMADFSTYIDYSDIFLAKLHENSTSIFSGKLLAHYLKCLLIEKH